LRFRFVIPAALLVAAAYARARRDATARRPVSARACDLPEDVRVRAEAEAADAFALAEEVVPAGASRPASPGRPPAVPVAVEELAATVAPPRPAPPASPAGWEVPEFPFAAARPAATRARSEARGPDLAALAEWSAAPAPARVAEAAEAPPREAESPDPAVAAEWTSPVAVPAAPVAVVTEGRFSLGGWATQAGHMALCGITFRDRHEHGPAAEQIRLIPDGIANVADGGVVVLGDRGFAPDAEGFTLLVCAAGPGAFAASGRYEVLSA
jgi:hypothetical protein